MPVVNITQDQNERFLAIKRANPQDSKASETFERMLKAYEGKISFLLHEKELAPTKNNTFQIVKSDK